MRLIGAELLKMRRRLMTYVLPGILIAVMAFVFFVVGGMVASVIRDFGNVLPSPEDASAIIYAIVGDFVFGLGSLLAVIYAGAIVGGDHTWGVLRNPIARGESREGYVLAKAAALAIVIALGAALCFTAGVTMILLVAASASLDLGHPLGADALFGFGQALGLGTLVLLERAAIGIAVALIMKSQLAGIVVAVVLYIAEPLIAGIATAMSTANPFLPGGSAAPAIHWSQFLPFSIGSSVLNEANAALGSLAGDLITNVPLVQSVPVLLAYLLAALTASAYVIRRQDIV